MLSPWFPNAPKRAQEDISGLARQTLLYKMLSGWPRRGRSLLLLHCGDGSILRALWEAGFDVTGQERDMALADQALALMGQRAEIVRTTSEALPFEDKSFHYVACVRGLETCSNPGGVLAEAFRLASDGVLLAHKNSFSLYGLGSALSQRCKTGQKHNTPTTRRCMLTPFKVWNLLRKHRGKGRSTWRSCLLGPSWSWRGSKPLRWLALADFPPPFWGAFTVVRVDLNQSLAGNMLSLPVRSRQTGPALSADYNAKAK